MKSLAVQRESFGASGMATRILVLRPAVWLNFDPCFMFLDRSEREAARQRWTEERARLPPALEARGPFPIAPRPPRAAPAFREARAAIALCPTVLSLVRTTLTDALVAAVVAEQAHESGECFTSTACTCIANRSHNLCCCCCSPLPAGGAGGTSGSADLQQIHDALGPAYGTAAEAQCALRAARSSDAHLCHGLHLLTLSLHTAADIDSRPSVDGRARGGERSVSAMRTLCTKLARCSPGAPSILVLLAHIVCAREYGTFIL